MKRLFGVSILIGFFSVAIVGLSQPSQGEDAGAVKASPPVPPSKVAAAAKPEIPRWQDDPVCQMVFFAVLEGLYTDGASDKVVDAVVPKGVTGDPMKTSFVLECPLCNPVYEAFRLYQSRPRFQQDASAGNTFGKGLDTKVEEGLQSQDRHARLAALAPQVSKWVKHRLENMNLGGEEKNQWFAQLKERSGQGKGHLRDLMHNDPDYKEGWSLYWGCAACNGVIEATNAK